MPEPTVEEQTLDAIREQTAMWRSVFQWIAVVCFAGAVAYVVYYLYVVRPAVEQLEDSQQYIERTIQMQEPQ